MAIAIFMSVCVFKFECNKKGKKYALAAHRIWIPEDDTGKWRKIEVAKSLKCTRS